MIDMYPHNIKQEGGGLPFSLQVLNLLPSQAVILALQVECFPTIRKLAKKQTKKRNGTHRRWQNEATATTRNGGIASLKWGGRQTYQMLSRQRGEIQSVAHSQPTNCEKGPVVYAKKIY